MHSKQMRELYQKTVQSYRRDPLPGESEAWEAVLENYTEPDVDAAIRRWQSDTKIDDFTHRPVGARMPSAAELKHCIDSFNSKVSRLSAGRFVSCGKCDDGWVRDFKGITVGPDPGGPQPVDPKIGAVKRCQCFHDYCANKMHTGETEPPKRKSAKRQDVAALSERKAMP